MSIVAVFARSVNSSQARMQNACSFQRSDCQLWPINIEGFPQQGACLKIIIICVEIQNTVFFFRLPSAGFSS